jgi:hypothetical protein
MNLYVFNTNFGVSCSIKSVWPIDVPVVDLSKSKISISRTCFTLAEIEPVPCI